jgi:hypothetical protein
MAVQLRNITDFIKSVGYTLGDGMDLKTYEDKRKVRYICVAGHEKELTIDTFKNRQVLLS